MNRLLTILFFLAGCGGPQSVSTESREPVAVKANQSCSELCAEVREAASQAPREPAREAGDACLCFEPLGAIDKSRPAAASRALQSKADSGRKKKRR